MNAEGVKILVKRSRPILAADAVPTIFHGQNQYVPKYLSSSRSTGRTDAVKKKKEALEREEAVKMKNLETNDIIKNFGHCLKSWKDKIVNSVWKFEICQNVYFAFKLILHFTDDIPRVITTVKVDGDMYVAVIVDGCYVDLNWIFGNQPKLSRWSQFQKLPQSLR